ncbi:MAG: hypothetical protein DMG96_29150 [Acidobacteria bacterium]|nr:MAG: hypothetical protein DMG96_29150 [Acidobacteriota bacterium]
MNPLRVIKDDKELYNYYRDSLRERSRVAISIQGASDEHRIQTENALQELLTAEMIKLAHDELRGRGVGNDLLDERGLRSSLEEVRLPERDRTILEAKVRRLARRMMMSQDDTEGGWDPGEGGRPKPSRPLPPLGMFEQHVGGPICICLSSSIPGTTLALDGVPRTPPPGSTSINMAIELAVDNFWGRMLSGDLLKLVIEPGAAFGIAPDQMQVGLASAVSWAKEIYAYNLCMGKLASVHQDEPNATPSFMLLMKECGGADTIVFAKPEFTGVWADVSNFEPTQFWPTFGGKRLTFTWLADPAKWW